MGFLEIGTPISGFFELSELHRAQCEDFFHFAQFEEKNFTVVPHSILATPHLALWGKRREKNIGSRLK
jgi:hypothetical protein